MNVNQYLIRLNHHQSIALDEKLLSHLHFNHVINIPFENLDIYLNKRFDLDLQNIFSKVIIKNRGGFCYELNYLFNALLTKIGFESHIIEARIFDENEIEGPPFDHMAICVKTNKHFLLDVGYGDLFITPLEIKEGIQFDGRNYFKIENRTADNYLLSMSSDKSNFKKRYCFRLNPMDIRDFDAICLDKQINPSSYFVKNTVCTKSTVDGRITIFNQKIIETINGKKAEKEIKSEDELRGLLEERFGIVI